MDGQAPASGTDFARKRAQAGAALRLSCTETAREQCPCRFPHGFNRYAQDTVRFVPLAAPSTWLGRLRRLENGIFLDPGVKSDRRIAMKRIAGDGMAGNLDDRCARSRGQVHGAAIIGDYKWHMLQ